LAVLDPAVGAILLVSGAVAWWRRRTSLTGPLAVLTAVCWYAGAVVPSLALLHRGPVVHLLVTHPTGRAVRPATRVAVMLGWLLAIVGSVLGSGWPALLTAVLLGVVALGRARGLAGRAHHLETPASVAMLCFVAVLVVAGVNVLGDLDADPAVAVVYDLVVALLVVGLCATLLRAPWTEDTLADLVTGLGVPEEGQQGLVLQLRRILNDPALVIGYWSNGRSEYVDEHGQPLGDVPPGRAAAVVTDDDRPAALLIHDETLVDDPELLKGITAAVRLAVVNAAMRRDARDRVARLTNARRRLVEVADAERTAFSRRLDEGPQARLRRIDELLQALVADGCPDVETTIALRQALGMARRELRELAYGVRPVTLTEGGLGAALPALAAGCPVPTTVTVDVDRLAPAAEAGLYFFCAEALANAAKHASASQVRVTVRTERSTVVAEVVDDGIGGADPDGSGLRGLTDRIEALGGAVDVGEADPRGVRLIARVPVCEMAAT
jgi:signal transduction histidine kinase